MPKRINYLRFERAGRKLGINHVLGFRRLCHGGFAITQVVWGGLRNYYQPQEVAKSSHLLQFFFAPLDKVNTSEHPILYPVDRLRAYGGDYLSVQGGLFVRSTY